jgi:hypothetical protein
MDEGVKENRVAVIALHKSGKSHSKIFELLKPSKSLQMIIYWANKHYKELWRVEDRARPGRPRSERTEAAIKSVGADSPKSTPKTEDHVPRAEHINFINVSLCQGQSTDEGLLVVKGAPPYTRFEGVPSVGPWRVQASTSSTINCGLFWRIWCAESLTTTWKA